MELISLGVILGRFSKHHVRVVRNVPTMNCDSQFARDRTIVFERPQFIPQQLGENATNFVDSDHLSCPPNMAR
jgi:hypothetical protein